MSCTEPGSTSEVHSGEPVRAEVGLALLQTLDRPAEHGGLAVRVSRPGTFCLLLEGCPGGRGPAAGNRCGARVLEWAGACRVGRFRGTGVWLAPVRQRGQAEAFPPGAGLPSARRGWPPA